MQPNIESTDIASTNITEPRFERPSEKWFEYPVRVHPHHTDYAGVVWHGSYITWMEEARIECLRFLGVGYADLVAMGCELPVVDLSIRYHRSLQFGTIAIVKTRLLEMAGVRIKWDYRIESTTEPVESATGQELCVTAQVTLVAIDRKRGKIMRQLPSPIKDILMNLATQV